MEYASLHRHSDLSDMGTRIRIARKYRAAGLKKVSFNKNGQVVLTPQEQRLVEIHFGDMKNRKGYMLRRMRQIQEGR